MPRRRISIYVELPAADSRFERVEIGAQRREFSRGQPALLETCQPVAEPAAARRRDGTHLRRVGSASGSLSVP